MRRILRTVVALLLVISVLSGCSGSSSSDMETLRFGRYGGEDIEWIVLKKDGSSELIISRYAIDAIPLNEDWVDTTWETSSLRKWLNNGFIDVAFSQEEQDKILPAHLSNPDNPSYGTHGGNDTDDRVYLLSNEEAEALFESDDLRKTAPTSYAESRGGQKHINGMIYWWTRTPGCEGRSVSFVHSAGYVNDRGRGVTDYSIGVRPAMWIKTGQ